MPWRYRKSVKVGPFRMTASKSGLSVSAGVKGLRVSTGPRGTRVTASIPGTGISYSEKLGSRGNVERVGDPVSGGGISGGTVILAALVLAALISGVSPGLATFVALVGLLVGLSLVGVGPSRSITDQVEVPYGNSIGEVSTGSAGTVYSLGVSDYLSSLRLRDEGLLLAEAGDHEGAVAKFTASVELADHFITLATSLTCRGIAYEALGRQEEALSDFNLAIKTEPTYPVAYNQRGNIHVKVGDWSAALVDYTTAASLDPKAMGVFIKRGITRRFLGDLAGAMADFTVVVQSRAAYAQPFKSQAYHYRGELYFDAGNSAAALRDLQKYLDLEPFAADRSEVEEMMRSLRHRQRKDWADGQEVPRSPYAILGVAVGTSKEEIVAAYRRLVQQYHPDKVATMAPEIRELTERRMKEINAAYGALIQ